MATVPKIRQGSQAPTPHDVAYATRGPERQEDVVLTLVSFTVGHTTWWSTSLVPVSYVPLFPETPAYQYQIITNWLDLEVDDHIEERLPILRSIAGHRNRECHVYLHEVSMPYWDVKIAAAYGCPGAVA